MGNDRSRNPQTPKPAQADNQPRHRTQLEDWQGTQKQHQLGDRKTGSAQLQHDQSKMKDAVEGQQTVASRDAAKARDGDCGPTVDDDA